MRRSSLAVALAGTLLFMSIVACSTDSGYRPGPGSNPYNPPAPEPPAAPAPEPVNAASMPEQLVGFWYHEDAAGGGVKATRSYTFYPTGEYLHEQSFCSQGSCQIQGQEAGSVVVELDVMTMYPTGGGSRQTRFSIQLEYGTNDIQLWLHDAYGPGVPDMYYLRG